MSRDTEPRSPFRQRMDGYTPPVSRPPETPPPQGLIPEFLAAYRDLRVRSRRNSMSWWTLKVIQGLLLGGGIFALGGLLAMLSALLEFGVSLTLGLLMMGAGVLVFVRYAAAPFTCQWIITVPENEYYVIEDFDGYTVQYLDSGRLIVPWRMQVRVKPYVRFKNISFTETVEDILNSHALLVSIEVRVMMVFDPTQADPERYATLRNFDTPAAFQDVLARQVREIVRSHLNALDPMQQPARMLNHARTLENAISEQLAGNAALGLALAGRRPVAVYMRLPRQASDTMLNMNFQARPQQPVGQIPPEVEELARRLNVPYASAYLLYQLVHQRINLAGSSGLHQFPIVSEAPTMPSNPNTQPQVDLPPDEPTQPSINRPQRPPRNETPPDPLDTRHRRRSRRPDND